MAKAFLEKNRIEAFSDGVIAIIITLLVLEIKVPHIEGAVTSDSLLHALNEVTPKFSAWALSFFMVLIMWVNHHRIFNEIKKSDNGLLWANGLLLFFMSFIPFPTAFLGDYFWQPISIFFFGMCLAAAGIGFYILRVYLTAHKELLNGDIDIVHYRKLSRLTLIGPLFYTIGAVFGFINAVVSMIIFACIPIYFVFFGTKNTR